MEQPTLSHHLRRDALPHNLLPPAALGGDSFGVACDSLGMTHLRRAPPRFDPPTRCSTRDRLTCALAGAQAGAEGSAPMCASTDSLAR